MSEGLAVWKKSYPILKDIGFGWFLVAHENGPAIARSEGWQYIGHLARHSTDMEDEVPAAIRYAATEALMEWAAKQPTYPTPIP